MRRPPAARWCQSPWEGMPCLSVALNGAELYYAGSRLGPAGPVHPWHVRQRQRVGRPGRPPGRPLPLRDLRPPRPQPQLARRGRAAHRGDARRRRRGADPRAGPGAMPARGQQRRRPGRPSTSCCATRSCCAARCSPSRRSLRSTRLARPSSRPRSDRSSSRPWPTADRARPSTPSSTTSARACGGRSTTSGERSTARTRASCCPTCRCRRTRSRPEDLARVRVPCLVVRGDRSHPVLMRIAELLAEGHPRCGAGRAARVWSRHLRRAAGRVRRRRPGVRGAARRRSGWLTPSGGRAPSGGVRPRRRRIALTGRGVQEGALEICGITIAVAGEVRCPHCGSLRSRHAWAAPAAGQPSARRRRRSRRAPRRAAPRCSLHRSRFETRGAAGTATR